MDPEVITLSEISQTRKVSYCTNLHLSEASRMDKFMETKNLRLPDSGKGGEDRELNFKISQHPYKLGKTDNTTWKMSKLVLYSQPPAKSKTNYRNVDNSVSPVSGSPEGLLNRLLPPGGS